TGFVCYHRPGCSTGGDICLGMFGFEHNQMVRTIVLLESRGRFVAWSFRWSRIRQRIWRIVRIRGDENFIKDKSIFPHPEVDLVLARSSNFKTSGWIFKGCVGPDKAI